MAAQNRSMCTHALRLTSRLLARDYSLSVLPARDAGQFAPEMTAQQAEKELTQATLRAQVHQVTGLDHPGAQDNWPVLQRLIEDRRSNLRWPRLCWHSGADIVPWRGSMVSDMITLSACLSAWQRRRCGRFPFPLCCFATQVMVSCGSKGHHVPNRVRRSRRSANRAASRQRSTTRHGFPGPLYRLNAGRGRDDELLASPAQLCVAEPAQAAIQPAAPLPCRRRPGRIPMCPTLDIPE